MESSLQKLAVLPRINTPPSKRPWGSIPPDRLLFTRLSSASRPACDNVRTCAHQPYCNLPQVSMSCRKTWQQALAKLFSCHRNVHAGMVATTNSSGVYFDIHVQKPTSDGSPFFPGQSPGFDLSALCPVAASAVSGLPRSRCQSRAQAGRECTTRTQIRMERKCWVCFEPLGRQLPNLICSCMVDLERTWSDSGQNR